MSIAEKWNARYRAATGERQASRVLAENLHLLPERGLALDLACGLGANSILLARQGLKVAAWDIADVAIAALQETAVTVGAGGFERVFGNRPFHRQFCCDPGNQCVSEDRTSFVTMYPNYCGAFQCVHRILAQAGG